MHYVIGRRTSLIRYVAVYLEHSSQPGAADWFCAPTAGDAVLPLS